MGFPSWQNCVFLLLSILSLASVQSITAGDGYTGYSLELSGDPDSAVYDTLDTPSNVSTTNPPPDVYLNASVSVGEIDINVENLTAKINVEAQVLSLLQFNAGVDLSIDSVSLLIENVTAKVLLEARLANLVTMIDDVLDSIDLNPIIATLGNDVGQLLNTTVSDLPGVSSTSSSTAAEKRSLDIANNILYSVNNYSGDRHTNRILSQDGDIIDESLDNNGRITGTRAVGTYQSDMTFNGHNQTVTRDGKVAYELQYDYNPFHGLSIVSAIFMDEAGTVIATQVLSESGAGGSSSIDGEL